MFTTVYIPQRLVRLYGPKQREIDLECERGEVKALYNEERVKLNLQTW